MATTPMSDAWTEQIVRSPEDRRKQMRLARITETAFSLMGMGWMFVAVWGLTAGGPVLGWVDQYMLAGIALLCFNGSMMVAASGGIRRRLIALVTAIEQRRTRS